MTEVASKTIAANPRTGSSPAQDEMVACLAKLSQQLEKGQLKEAQFLLRSTLKQLKNRAAAPSLPPTPAPPAAPAPELPLPENLLAALVQAVPLPVVALDRTGSISLWNSTAEAVFGWSASEVLGKPAPFVPRDKQVEFENLVRGGLQGGRREALTITRVTREGCRLNLRLWASPIYDSCGRPQGLIGIMGDETAPQALSGALQRSEQRLEILFGNAADAIFVHDLQGNFLEVNKAACNSLGYSRDELLGITVPLVEIGFTKQQLETLWQNLLPASPVTVEGHHRRKDGSTFPVEVHLTRFEGGPHPLILASARDITARKSAEQRSEIFAHLGRRLSAIRNRRQAAETIFEAISQLFEWENMELNLTDGDSPPFVWKRDRLNPSDKEQARFESELVVPVRAGCRRIGQLVLRHTEPHCYEADAESSLQSLADHCSGALERLRVEEELERQRSEQETILDSVPALIFYKDTHNRNLRVNRAVAETVGCKKSELEGRVAFSSSPEQVQKYWDDDNEVIQTGKPKRGIVECISTHRGTRWLLTDKVPYRNSAGEIIGIIGFALDITERRQAEEDLRKSEALYHSLVENLPQNIFRKDLSGRFTFANGRFCDTIGRPVSEIIGATDFDLFEEKLAVKYQQDDRKILETGRSLEAVEEHPHLDREHTHVQVVKIPLYDSDGRSIGIQGIFWDISDRLQLEFQLRQAQKLESIGRLAGGVAHDFNNLLTIIQGHCSLLLHGDSLTDPLAESARQITMAADRAARLTQQLLTFSRRQRVELHHVDLNEVMSNLSKMLRRILGEDISLAVHFAPVLPLIRADIGMLEQVLLNLSVNARDAMPKGGTIRLQTDTVFVTESDSRRHPDARPGRSVRLTLSDTGSGISTEDLPHIFEPFFTTKEVGRGTGLGLATVYGIIKQHNGWIEVRSTLGRGTSFDMFFPAANLKEAPTSSTDTPDEISAVGTEGILLVEDEQDVCQLIGEALRSYGYTVHLASSAHEALDLWKERRREIHLIITDLVLPGGMSGRDLAEQVRQQAPNLKVLFVSGYSPDVIGSDFPLTEHVDFVQKPFAPHTLARAVRRRLDQTES